MQLASVRLYVIVTLGTTMFILLLLFLFSTSKCDKPHIILIVADDLGWNDVGFHGMNQVPTPNIDALAYSGVMLHNYYVTPICTPSRAALMTAKYPIHTGMQHTVIFGAEPRGLPLSEKLLPQYLKELHYKTHLVGKWHLGSYKREYLPLFRGFDSHLGFWAGKIDMYDHTNVEKTYWGFDFRRNMSVAHDLFGKYATDIYTEEAVKIIHNHNEADPLFLMVSHSAVHTGNPNEPIRAPDDVIANFSHIEDYQRQKFAGVLAKLDESVGQVVAALKSKNLLENSIIIFTTDNGGPPEGFNDNRASNYPLRGVKNTLWEGGVRGAGLLWSPLIQKKSRIAKQRFHLVDWLPTLLSAAGMNISTLNNIDGIDQWNALSNDLKSERNSILHNIDDEYGCAAITVGKWKLHKGTNYDGAWDFWYGPAARDGHYDVNRVVTSPAGLALGEIDLMPNREKIFELREKTTLKCDRVSKIACNPLKAPCLFDIEEDPCETINLADSEPKILEQMLEELEKINKTAIPPNNRPLDPKGDPRFWGHAITNFGDYENENFDERVTC